MRLLTPLALALSMAGLLAGCASTGIDSDDPHAPMHEGHAPAQMSGATSSAEMDAAPGKSETVRGDGKPDWAAVYETPPGTRAAKAPRNAPDSPPPTSRPTTTPAPSPCSRS